MRKLIVALDDDISKELAKYPNQSETLREAFRIYNGNISTDTLAGLRTAFTTLLKSQNEMAERLAEQYEMVERMHNTLEEFRNR